jgi:hypothetical protein
VITPPAAPPGTPVPCSDSQFWLSMTKVERKIASSETMRVSNPNGKGSNAQGLTLMMIHAVNYTTWR